MATPKLCQTIKTLSNPAADLLSRVCSCFVPKLYLEVSPVARWPAAAAGVLPGRGAAPGPALVRVRGGGRAGDGDYMMEANLSRSFEYETFQCWMETENTFTRCSRFPSFLSNPGPTVVPFTCTLARGAPVAKPRRPEEVQSASGRKAPICFCLALVQKSRLY